MKTCLGRSEEYNNKGYSTKYCLLYFIDGTCVETSTRTILQTFKPNLPDVITDGNYALWIRTSIARQKLILVTELNNVTNPARKKELQEKLAKLET